MRFVLFLMLAAGVGVSQLAAAELKEAQEAFRKGEFRQVVALLDEDLRQNPTEIRAYSLRGRALIEMCEYGKGLVDLDKAIDSQRGERGADHYYRGRGRIAVGQIEGALDDLNQSIEANPKIAARYLARGEAWLGKSDPTKAIDDFSQAIALAPQSPPAWMRRGLARLQQSCELEFIQYTKGNQTYLTCRLKSIKDRAGVEQSVADFSKAIELDANFYDAIENRMEAYRLLGNKGVERMADLESLCKLRPEDPGLLNNLAWDRATHFLKHLRNGKQAVELAEKAVRLTDRKYPVMLDTLAASYAETGQFDKAVATITEAIEKFDSAATQAPLQQRLELYKSGKPFHRTRSSKASARAEAAND